MTAAVSPRTRRGEYKADLYEFDEYCVRGAVDLLRDARGRQDVELIVLTELGIR